MFDVPCFSFNNFNVLSCLTGLVIALATMALSNPLFDEDIQSNNDDDPPKNEESTDGGELVNDPAQTALSPTETILSSVRKLLECPVCLNRMYPPIHQVAYQLLMMILLLNFRVLEKAFFFVPLNSWAFLQKTIPIRQLNWDGKSS
jgi:hypothetical protein